MGLLAWIKGRKSTSTATSITATHTASVDLGHGHETVVRDGVEVGDLAQQQAVVDEIDHLAHQFLTAGAASAGSGGMIVMSSASVIIDGQAVNADDPRAREKTLEAVAKLRAQGFDELANDLERQLGAAARAATGGPQSAAPTDASPVSTADAPEAPSAPTAPSPPSGPV